MTKKPEDNFDITLIDFDGKELRNPDGILCPQCGQPIGDGKLITAKSILMHVAALPFKDDPEGKNALAAFDAGLKVAHGDSLLPEDKVLLKKRLFASGYNNVIKGQVAKALDT